MTPVTNKSVRSLFLYSNYPAQSRMAGGDLESGENDMDWKAWRSHIVKKYDRYVSNAFVDALTVT